MKKLIALTLVLMSVMAVALPAYASGSLLAKPGEKNTTSTFVYSGGSRVSYLVRATLRAGDTVRVFLDVYNPERNQWVERDSVKWTTAGDHSTTLSYTLDSNENEVRLRTYGYEDNSGNISVSYW